MASSSVIAWAAPVASLLLLVPTAVATLVVVAAIALVAAVIAQVGEGKGRDKMGWVPPQVVNNQYFFVKSVNNL